MSGHTPGPWEIVIDGTCSGAWPYIVPEGTAIDDAFEFSIAELSTTHVEKTRKGLPGTYSVKPERFRPTDDHDEIMANARLISAAPEMLEAMQQAFDFPPDFFDRSDDELEQITVSGRHLRMVRAAIAKATGEQP